MKKIVVLCIALLLSGVAWSQDIGSNQGQIKTLVGNTSHFGFYGGLSFQASKLKNENIMMGGVKFAALINRTLGIGFEGYGIIPHSSSTNYLTGQDVIPLGGYGGLMLEPILFSNKAVHFTFPVSAGAGWLGYHEDWGNEFNNSSDLIEGDVFWYVQPGANVEFNISRAFRINLGINRRFVQDLDLPETTNDDFSKMGYYMTLKFGRF
ncbi:MAG: hypothetical protein ACPGJS_22915 [Flammeovirgaceae bacterium]